MKKEIKDKINKAAKRGLSEYAIKTILTELYETDVVRFDNEGNPYWEASGELIDPDVELKFE